MPRDDPVRHSFPHPDLQTRNSNSPKPRGLGFTVEGGLGEALNPERYKKAFDQMIEMRAYIEKKARAIYHPFSEDATRNVVFCAFLCAWGFHCRVLRCTVWDSGFTCQACGAVSVNESCRGGLCTTGADASISLLPGTNVRLM